MNALEHSQLSNLCGKQNKGTNREEMSRQWLSIKMDTSCPLGSKWTTGIRIVCSKRTHDIHLGLEHISFVHMIVNLAKLEFIICLINNTILQDILTLKIQTAVDALSDVPEVSSFGEPPSSFSFYYLYFVHRD